jgi:hypothetical protein
MATAKEGVYLKPLRKNYKKTSCEDIVKHLERILIVQTTHKGVGSVYGYYAIDGNTLANIKKAPRGISHTFDFKPGEHVPDLKEFKRITFLVKSSSRFFMKPDIGEIFDQMTEEDLRETKAIETLHEEAVAIYCPEGDEFLVKAILLK